MLSIKVKPTAVHWIPIQYPPRNDKESQSILVDELKVSSAVNCTENEADAAKRISKNVTGSPAVGLNILADICAQQQQTNYKKRICPFE